MKMYEIALLLFIGLGAQPSLAKVTPASCADIIAAEPAPAPAPKPAPEEEPDCE